MIKLIEKLERLPLRLRLILGFGSVLLLALALALQSLRTQEQFNRDAQGLYESEVLGIARVKEAQLYFARFALTLHQVLHPKDGERELSMRRLAAARAQLHSAVAQVGPTLMRAENIQRWKQFESLLARLEHFGDSATEGEAAQQLQEEATLALAADADRLLTEIAAVKERSADQAIAEIH